MFFSAGFLVLLALSVDAKREYVKAIRPHANTNWGKWGAEDWCLGDQFAYGFSLKVQKDMFLVDRTGVNGIKLLCRSFCGAHGHDVESTVQKWGNWKNTRYCPGHHFLKGVSMRSDAWRFLVDQTAVNDFTFVCESSINPSETYKLRGNGISRGTWSPLVSCPRNSYICGIKTEVQKDMHLLDDTSLNGAIFYCCRFHGREQHCP